MSYQEFMKELCQAFRKTMRENIDTDITLEIPFQYNDTDTKVFIRYDMDNENMNIKNYRIWLNETLLCIVKIGDNNDEDEARAIYTKVLKYLPISKCPCGSLKKKQDTHCRICKVFVWYRSIVCNLSW